MMRAVPSRTSATYTDGSASRTAMLASALRKKRLTNYSITSLRVRLRRRMQPSEHSVSVRAAPAICTDPCFRTARGDQTVCCDEAILASRRRKLEQSCRPIRPDEIGKWRVGSRANHAKLDGLPFGLGLAGSIPSGLTITSSITSTISASM